MYIYACQEIAMSISGLQSMAADDSVYVAQVVC